MHPLNFFLSAQGVGESVERVTDHAIDTAHPDGMERFGHEVSNGMRHSMCSSDSRNTLGIYGKRLVKIEAQTIPDLARFLNLQSFAAGLLVNNSQLILYQRYKGWERGLVTRFP
jgi:hypothetical protein